MAAVAAITDVDLPHVLVVDDDDRLRDLLGKFLGDNGFIVATAADAADARRRMRSLAFDIIVLDLMMPGESGLDFAVDLRQRSDLPILMLTAMGEADARIAGLEAGADDYLAKPFEPRELLLRLHSILRRVPSAITAPLPVQLGDCCFDPVRGELTRRGKRVHLTEVEASLLVALSGRAGEVIGRDALIAMTGATGGGRAVDVQVTRLRRKIESDPRMPRDLQTVRGKGYVLHPD